MPPISACSAPRRHHRPSRGPARRSSPCSQTFRRCRRRRRRAHRWLHLPSRHRRLSCHRRSSRHLHHRQRQPTLVHLAHAVHIRRRPGHRPRRDHRSLHGRRQHRQRRSSARPLALCVCHTCSHMTCFSCVFGMLPCTAYSALAMTCVRGFLLSCISSALVLQVPDETHTECVPRMCDDPCKVCTASFARL